MSIFETILELALHRNYCLNCKGPLQLVCYDREGTNIFDNVKVDIMDKYIRIYNPGKYEIRLDQESCFQLFPNTSRIIASLKHPKLTYSFLTLRKTCTVCNSADVPKNLKHLLPGFRDITDMSFFELLILFDTDRNKFSASLIKDVNVCYEDDFLYIVDCMRYSSIITIKGPNYFLCEAVPKLDLRDFKTSEDMVKHLKMIMAFS